MQRALRGLACLAALAASPGPARAQLEFSASPDVALDLAVTSVLDREAVRDDGAGLALLDLPALDAGVDLVALDAQADGSLLFSLDVTASLPGALIARPSDVVRKDGALYTLAFDGGAHNFRSGVGVDAVGRLPSGELILSFDVAVDLGSVRADDEDLVSFDGSAFALLLDASAQGFDPALDLDGVAYAGEGRLAVSFDATGERERVFFDDEDVLTFQPGGPDPHVNLLYDASAVSAAWEPADLDAVALPEPGATSATALGALLVALLSRRASRTRRPR
jgi:hypothetical protein